MLKYQNTIMKIYQNKMWFKQVIALLNPNFIKYVRSRFVDVLLPDKTRMVTFYCLVRDLHPHL